MVRAVQAELERPHKGSLRIIDDRCSVFIGSNTVCRGGKQVAFFVEILVHKIFLELNKSLLVDSRVIRPARELGYQLHDQRTVQAVDLSHTVAGSAVDRHRISVQRIAVALREDLIHVHDHLIKMVFKNTHISGLLI